MRYILALLILICSSVSVPAQVKVSNSKSLSAAERNAALQSIEDNFQKIYVLEEMRPLIVEHLKKNAETKRYDVSDPYLFAERITQDLKDVAKDEHLYLKFDPAAFAAAIAPPKSDAGDESFRRNRAIRSNHGLTEMRILPGNIRYLKIIRFEWVTDETGAIYDEAMRFLKGGDAWIVDLRGNGGGTSSAANYFVSHFHAPETVSYISYAGTNPPERSAALDYLPVGRLTGKPLYILIDGAVGSAAEAVAYDLQQFKIAELIGAKTAGAANNNKLVPIAPGFILSISYGRPIHVISKTNWEGIGVKPDVECDPNTALDVAQSLALKKLSEKTDVSAQVSNEYRWTQIAVEARLNPVTFTHERKKEFSGKFTSKDYGEIEVKFENGDLWLKRPNRPLAKLYPLTKEGLFGIEGNELLRVRLNGKTLELFWWEYPTPRIFSRP